MSPLRILVLTLLLVIAYRMGKRQWSRQTGSKAAGDASGSTTGHDVLEEDPVCHTLVPRRQAIRLRHEGRIYYFCSESCCDRFLSKHSKGTDEP